MDEANNALFMAQLADSKSKGQFTSACLSKVYSDNSRGINTYLISTRVQSGKQQTANSGLASNAVGTTASIAQYALNMAGHYKIGFLVGAIGATTSGAIDGSFAGPYGAAIGGMTGFAWFLATQAISEL